MSVKRKNVQNAYKEDLKVREQGTRERKREKTIDVFLTFLYSLSFSICTTFLFMNNCRSMELKRKRQNLFN
jgi:hypothetical protein